MVRPVENIGKKVVKVQKFSKNHPIEKLKNDVNYQSRPFVTCPLPLRPPSKTDINKPWEKKVGNEKLKITTADTDFGIPYGQDNLIILYLIKKALEQNNNGIIEFKSLNDFLKIFGFSRDKKTYKKIKKGFNRIYNARFQYVRKDKIKNNIILDNYQFLLITDWVVFFSEQEGQPEMFKSYIKLTQTFWDMINKRRVPYNLNIVKELKQSPAVVNLYILISYRSYINWHDEKKEIFIPFFGKNSLQDQLSSKISRRRRFKEEIIDYLERIKKYWPDCPVYLRKETNFKKKGPASNKIFKDGLFIHVKKASQLSVSPHWPKLLRQAREEAEALPNKKSIAAIEAARKEKRGV